MKRFVIAVAVCGAVALSMVGDAMANYILIPGSDMPFCRGVGFVDAYFVSDEGVDREFTAYGVLVEPDGKVKPLLLWERVGGIPRWLYPIQTQIMAIGWMSLHNCPDAGEYKVVMAFFDPNKPITKIEDAFQVLTASFTIASDLP